MGAPPDPFYIGWARTPRALRGFLAACALGLLALFSAAGYLVAATADDPGAGAFRFDWGPQTVVGRVETEPYPLLHVLDSDRYPAGTTLLLSGIGKRGVQGRATPLDGQLVKATGIMLARGDLAMMQVAGGANGLAPANGDPATTGAVTGRPAQGDPDTAGGGSVHGDHGTAGAEALGRWRLTGEICDGKCYAGAMRPGRGLAHRACANLCLVGGVPPVFVSTAPIEGERFLLLADESGGPVTDAVLDHVATRVEIEGAVERRGSLLVFRIAPATLRLAR